MPRLAPVIKTVFFAMFIIVLLSGPLSACPILLVYCVKLCGGLKLIGPGGFFVVRRNGCANR